MKAQFVVTAGIIPGQPMAEHTKVWQYTDVDFAADGALPPMPEGYELDLCGRLDQPHMSRFTRMLIEMQRYQSSVISPAHLNWAKAEWMWM